MPKSIKGKKKHFKNTRKNRKEECNTFEVRRFRKLVAELKRKNGKKVDEKKDGQQKDGQQKDIAPNKK
jgi:hypothetical protein